jgi:sugar phosphate isomerase/epimerase
MAKPRLGLQLYSLRDFETTEIDFARTMERVAKIGYRTVQVSGIGDIADDRVAQITSDNGLSIVATHAGWDEFTGDLEALIARHQLWNCKHTAIGMVPKEYLNLDGIQQFKRELTPIAERMSEVGMTFSYHNHSIEMAHFDGTPYLEHLYAQIPGETLRAELDTYWIAAGGGDPAEWIRRYPGRQPLLHVKDMVGTLDWEPRFAACGSGNLNWPAILSAAEEAGAEYALVEQDQFYEQDPFEAVTRSFEFLKAAGCPV